MTTRFHQAATAALTLTLTATLAHAAAPSRKSASSRNSAAAAPRTYLLQYKFQVGEVLRYDVSHSTSVRTAIDGTTEEVQTRSDSVKAWKVTDVLPSGEMEFVHLVESVRMTNRSPGKPGRSFDSSRDKTPPAGFEQAAAAVGVPLTIVRIKPCGEVSHREAKHPQPTPADDLPITLLLPQKPVAVGESWTRTYGVVAQRQGGAQQQVQTRRRCKLQRVNGGVATIAVDYEILSPVDAYIRSQLVERLTRGSVDFNLAQGRIVRQQHDVDRRLLGFAGKTSSMHFLSRIEERLLPATAVADRDDGVRLTSRETEEREAAPVKQ